MVRRIVGWWNWVKIMAQRLLCNQKQELIRMHFWLRGVDALSSHSEVYQGKMIIVVFQRCKCG